MVLKIMFWGIIFHLFLDLFLLPFTQAEIKCNTVDNDSNIHFFAESGPNPKFDNPKYPYVIDAGAFSPEYVAQIKKGMDSIEEQSCIRFEDVTGTGQNYTFIIYNVKGGCRVWHYKSATGIIMELDPEQCGHWSILHELMHAMGFHHEHQRFDRDTYVEMKWANDPQYKYEYGKFNKEYIDEFTPYDFDSIMHYPAYYNITVKTPGVTDDRLGQGKGLSELDRVKLNRAYKCYEERKDCVDTSDNETPNCTVTLMTMRETATSQLKDSDICSRTRQRISSKEISHHTCAKTCGYCRCIIWRTKYC